MKSLLYNIAGISLGVSAVFSNPAEHFTNYFVQQELPHDGSEGTRELVYVPDEGQQLSPIAINPGGARFELWTVDGRTLTEHLLDHQYVSDGAPVAEVKVISEDPFPLFPRTRADRPFDVLIETQGLHTDNPDATASLKSVRLARHVQSYGPEGVGDNIDRNQATLLQEVFLVNNQIHHFSFPVNAIPGEDRAKIRGEERFTVYSVEDERSPSSQLSSMFMQVWPVADGSISGITSGEVLRFQTPQLTFTYRDLYPTSDSYAQLYPGPPVLGTEGRRILGSGPGPKEESAPFDVVEVMQKWDRLIDQDGQWTLELLTDTPFGTDRLDYVTFTVNRSIEVQGSVTTSE